VLSSISAVSVGCKEDRAVGTAEEIIFISIALAFLSDVVVRAF